MDSANLADIVRAFIEAEADRHHLPLKRVEHDPLVVALKPIVKSVSKTNRFEAKAILQRLQIDLAAEPPTPTVDEGL